MNKGARIYKKKKINPRWQHDPFKKSRNDLARLLANLLFKIKGNSCLVLENYKYLDMMCYVGQNTLGYSNSLVDKKVISSIQENMTSLNSYNEIILSEKLMQLHPWADMAKFARSGGEANAMAIRIARQQHKKIM